MNVIALIPARGGSKSLPRKNIRNIGGKPLIAYSIETALKCPGINRTIVSTDNVEIAEISRAIGAEVPFLRPAQFAADDSTDIQVLSHALNWMNENERLVPDLVVFLRPTEPLRRPETVQRAIETLIANSQADSLRSVRLAQQSPCKMWSLEAGWLQPVVTLKDVAEPYNQPRQQLPAFYWQDGYVDVIWSRTILEQGSSTGRKILGFLISEPSVNIDYEDELAAADFLLRGEKASTSSGEIRHPA